MKSNVKIYFLILSSLLFITYLIITIAQYPITENQKKSAVAKFENYINAYLNGYIVCPLQNDWRVRKHIEYGFLWRQKRAKQGDIASEFLTGIAYLSGIGTNIDIQEGRDWLFKSAMGNHSPAQAEYGFFLFYKNKYQNRKFFKEDFDAPYLFEWSKKSALRGNLHGIIGLVGYYLYKEKPKQAIPLIKKLAHEDYPIAQLILADLYYYGNGVPQDREKSLYWYRKVADHKPISMATASAVLSIIIIYSSPGPLKNNREFEYWIKKQDEIHAFIHCQKSYLQ